ncbi:hypothetical protein D0864_02406 [Hortaea werneckii]|uniref:Uncharacterized protein n=1 Tax=Hortaea werneckii TaxID=91943 RepID=A0A3M7GY87_HORWE|nr:hypothetical protein D0864_02406 [Hortaea werneckii]
MQLENHDKHVNAGYPNNKRRYAEQTQACFGEGDENINLAAERGRMISDKSAISLSRICELPG